MSAVAERSPHAICGRSYWRPLYDGGAHPTRFIMLGAKEVAELIATGGFTLDDREVPEALHQRREVSGHRLLGEVADRSPRLAVPRQVRAHDAEPGLDEQRRDAVPGRVRARVPVEQQHARAVAAVPHAQHGRADVHVLEREAWEERHRVVLPGSR